LANVVIVVLLLIVSNVDAVVVKTPANLAKDGGHAIVSAQYLSGDDQVRSYGALTPVISADPSKEADFGFTTLQQEKEL
jgi:hypothetical protein